VSLSLKDVVDIPPSSHCSVMKMHMLL